MSREEWVDVGPAEQVPHDEVVRFDHGDHSYAVYRTADSRYFATDGECTHGRVHLAKGFLSGVVIECAKHNGRFDITSGRALGAPALIDLGCYDVRILDGILQLRVGAPT